MAVGVEIKDGLASDASAALGDTSPVGSGVVTPFVGSPAGEAVADPVAVGSGEPFGEAVALAEALGKAVVGSGTGQSPPSSVGSVVADAVAEPVVGCGLVGSGVALAEAVAVGSGVVGSGGPAGQPPGGAGIMLLGWLAWPP